MQVLKEHPTIRQALVLERERGFRTRVRMILVNSTTPAEAKKRLVSELSFTHVEVRLLDTESPSRQIPKLMFGRPVSVAGTRNDGVEVVI